MIEVISHTEQTARKDYHDDLRDIFDYGWRPIGMTISERRTWIKYRDRRGIKKGDKYVRQFNKMDGDTYTWRAWEPMYKIFSKYDWFPDY